MKDVIQTFARMRRKTASETGDEGMAQGRRGVAAFDCPKGPHAVLRSGCGDLRWRKRRFQRGETPPLPVLCQALQHELPLDLVFQRLIP